VLLLGGEITDYSATGVAVIFAEMMMPSVGEAVILGAIY
jgi:hypothetical protein